MSCNLYKFAEKENMYEINLRTIKYHLLSLQKNFAVGTNKGKNTLINNGLDNWVRVKIEGSLTLFNLNKRLNCYDVVWEALGG